MKKEGKTKEKQRKNKGEGRGGRNSNFSRKVAVPARCLIFSLIILSHTTKSSEGEAGAAVCVGVSRHGTADTNTNNAAQVSQVGSRTQSRLELRRGAADGMHTMYLQEKLEDSSFESLCQPAAAWVGVGARGVRKA